MSISRRDFIGLTIAGTAGAFVAGCSGDESQGATRAVSPASLDAPRSLRALPEVVADPATGARVEWSAVGDAQSYDVEVNGFIVANSHHDTAFVVASGDGAPGVSSGANEVRVRARAAEVVGPWSGPTTFDVAMRNVVRVRGFDLEDDGPIDLSLGPDERAGATVLAVGSDYAFGGSGKGVTLRCADASDTKAYKNHDLLPVEECWIRLAFSPRSHGGEGKRVQIARINDPVSGTSERLVWITGTGVTTTSVKVVLPMADEAWVQLQMGIDADGKVELWAYDGTRETLVGTGRSTMTGLGKNRVSLGCSDRQLGITFEGWIDDFVVGRSRLPWARPDAPRRQSELRSLDPAALPSAFSFVFGSCSNSNHVPADGTALASAAATEADFVLHLGDLGYVDSSGYRQSVNGYLASWSDHLANDHAALLARRPWIRLNSDHDMGGNNVVAATVAEFAAQAASQYSANDRSVDPAGRYGSMELADGAVLLVWTEGVLYRSPLDQPDAPGNTKLGAEQKRWLFDLLGRSTARLILFASETTVGHESRTSWTNHPAERREVLDALAAKGVPVRMLSGDMHHACWARLADNIVEWGAAAMSEFPEGAPFPAADVLDAGTADYSGYHSRPAALEAMTLEEFNSTTTYGFASIDAAAGTATFEVRGPDGLARTDDQGRPMSETFNF